MKNPNKFIVKHGMFYGWHMLPPSRRLRYGDGRIANDNETLHVHRNYPILAGSYGLHMAVNPVQAISWGFEEATILCRTIGQGTYDIDALGETAAFASRTILWSINLEPFKTELRTLIGEQLIELCSEPVPETWINDIRKGVYRKSYRHYKIMHCAGLHAGALAKIIRKSASIYDIIAAGTFIDTNYLFISPTLEDIVNSVLEKRIPNYRQYLDGTLDEYVRRS